MSAAHYYAVCHMGGPISVEIYADNEDAAVEAFEALDHHAVCDGAATDLEDALEIDGSSMSESEFADALDAAGAELVRDLDEVVNAYSGAVRHLVGGWRLWRTS